MMMAINGSVSVLSDDDDNGYDEVGLDYFHPDDDDDGYDEVGLDYFHPKFKEYIQKEALKWPPCKTQCLWGGLAGWVFWSQHDHNTEPTLPLDNFAGLIRHALQKLIFNPELEGCLIQFWAPTRTLEGRTLLKTQFQPFALAKTYNSFERNHLCEYRLRMCGEYNYFYADAESGDEQLGLPGRVFLDKLPESTPNIYYYSLKEYPQRDLALRCGVIASRAVPVIEHSSHTCVGVLEIVSLSFVSQVLHHKSILGQMYDIFQEFGLQCVDGYKHCEMQIRDETKARTTAFQELKEVLKMVCEIHELPLAMTWIPCSTCNDLLRGQLLSEGVEFCEREDHCLAMFVEVSKSYHLRKGGVAGMVLSPPHMLYCSDITQLSLAEYPLVPYARLCEFRGWFTLCLQSSHTANDIYVLEFFLPKSNGYHDNSWTSLSLILETMDEIFTTFKLASGQELGDLLLVEVIDFQNGRKLQSIQKIQAKDGEAMLQPGQLDQPPIPINNGMNVVSEAQNYNLPSLESLQRGKVTTQLDSSDQLSMDPSKSTQNIVTAEQNTFVVTNSEGGTRERPERQHKNTGADQKKHKNTGVRIQVSLDDILECSKRSRNDAAKELQVSISTLKRVCREYGIQRWPPRDIEKLRFFRPLPVKKQRFFRPSPVKKQGQTRELNSDLLSNQDSDSVAHINPAFQDADIVKIRAKHENNTIKFRLSLPYRLAALQQEVAKRLNLEAGTYYVKYEDEENELILITCDDDLQDCINTSKSLGNTSVVVLLEPK